MYRNTTQQSVALRRSADSDEAETIRPGETSALTGVDMKLPQNASYVVMGVLEKVDGRARTARPKSGEGDQA
jgi:hypothetical protein